MMEEEARKEVKKIDKKIEDLENMIKERFGVLQLQEPPRSAKLEVLNKRDKLIIRRSKLKEFIRRGS